MAEPNIPELLPSVAQILKRAGALERDPGVDVQSVARLPVFQGRNWKRAIGEFLRWSGSTPEPWGGTSVFELLLCHGSAGARALFEAYRHDRLERAETFQEATSQLEAVRTVISMAAYWLHVISWDLRDARAPLRGGIPGCPARAQGRRPSEPRRARASPVPAASRGAPTRSRSGATILGARPGRTSSGVPIYPSDTTIPSLWKPAPEKREPDAARRDPLASARAPNVGR